MKKQDRANKLAFKAERIRELELERVPRVAGGRAAVSEFSACSCGGAGGGGSTTQG